MKPTTILLAAALLLAIASCDTQDPGTGTLPDGTQLTLHIPAPSPLAATRATATDKTAWQEGDVLYIRLRCYASNSGNIIQQTLHIAQRTAAGGWAYDTPLTMHPATSDFIIYAYYLSGALPGEAVAGDLLESGTISLADETTLTLEPFDHTQARITFTGLAEGEEITFEGNGWRQSLLDEQYELGSAGTPARITADADGDAVLYAFIEPYGTRQFTIAGQAYTFDPGEPNVDGTYYYNRTYTINYPKLLASGGMTPEEMEEEEKRAPFLAWATSDRWRTEDFTLTSDIDLTGVKFEPIGDFGQTFDGGGHTITGLTVETDGQYAGLFHNIYDGTVKNLHLRGVRIKSTHTEGFAGGITGENYRGTISGCTVQGEIIGNEYAGGIVGYSSGTGSITACGFQGTLTGAGYVGGIIGYAYGGSIAGCWALSTGGTNHEPIANGGSVAGCVGKDISYELTAQDLATMNTVLEGESYPLRWTLSVTPGGLPELYEPQTIEP